MVVKNKEKIERALGTRLFLKPVRGQSPKSAAVRKPYPPGIFGAKNKRKNISEYKSQLQEKQKIEITYGLSGKQMSSLFKSGLTSQEIFENLEKRLDNVVFRLGFALSRRMARQFISHRHILVNNLKVKTPSYKVRKGDIVSVEPSFLKGKIFQHILAGFKNFNPPGWLKLDKDNLKGEIIGEPRVEECNFDISLVINYYSR